MGLLLNVVIDGKPCELALEGGELRIGRGSDNDLVLPDFSVSRRHASVRHSEDCWRIVDLESTNGVRVNGLPATDAPLRGGDLLSIGVFDISVIGTGEHKESTHPAIPNATIVRRLSDFSADFGMGVSQAVLKPAPTPNTPSTPNTPIAKVEPSTSGSGSRRFFEFLNQLARDLIHTDTPSDVLSRVMDIAFAALPIDRGFILVGDTSGDVECRLARIGDEVEEQPEGELPISNTILQTVMEDQVGLLTLDALDDQRLLGGESIKIHGIRAAMCAPLWSGDKITGFIQVDSPFQTGSFHARHLDFLITLANYAAVGMQRLEERRLRGRLERYHSPAVLNEVLKGDQGSQEGQRGLHKKEVTVLFGDLVGFTAFAESSTLDEVADLLGGYCTRSVEAIFEEGGTLDKFIGDCVMAFFGAPMDQPDHAIRGVRAALRLQEAMDRWNEERRQNDLPEVLCRLGLNSGPAMVGDVGSDQRVDYTVLGNAVNIAARLESTVAEPGQIVIGESTRDQLSDDFELESLGAFTLRGLQQKVAAFRVLGGAGFFAGKQADSGQESAAVSEPAGSLPEAEPAG